VTGTKKHTLIDLFILGVCSLLLLATSPLYAGVNLTPQEQAFIQQHPEIRLGTDRSWEPYVIVAEDGSVSGYDAEILEAINQLTGANFSLVTGSWPDMQRLAKERKIDGLSTGAPIEKRRSYLNFSDNYLTLKKAVFVATGNPKEIYSIKDLDNKTIVIQQGNLADIELASQFPKSKILLVDTVEDVFSSLSDQRADVAFGNGATLYLANKLGMPYLQIAFHLDEQLDLVFATRNDWPEANSILNKGLSAIPDHEKVRIQTKWFSPQVSPSNNPEHNGSLYLSKEEQQIINQTTTLKLCIDPNWLPFDGLSSSGKHIGVSADLMKLISQRLGISFTLVKTDTWSETTQLYQQQACDLVTTITPTRERAEYLNFTQPLFSSPLVLATRLDQFFLSDISSVTHKLHAVVKDTAAIPFLKSRYPGIKLLEVESDQEGLKLLSEEKVFGFISSLEVIAHQVNADKHLNIKVSSTLPDKYSLSIGVRKDLPEWVPILNKAINSITDAERQQIHNRWVGIQYESAFDYRPFMSVMAVIAALAFLLLYRYRVISSYNNKLRILNEQLAQQATTDQLTDLPNRYLLVQEMIKEIAVSKRYQEPFSIVLFDIDLFKQINDQFGHQRGDVVLQEVSQIMNSLCREIDILGRWGGEEFLLLCPRTEMSGALKLANKIRLHIQQHYWQADTKVTLSAGVAEYSQGEDYHALLKRVDDVLYIAKNQGRNTVVCADPPPITQSNVN
jgi:polar amino acid transport system substrate-binding protein